MRNLTQRDDHVNQVYDSGRNRRAAMALIIKGIIWLVIGLIVTIGTYRLASSSSSGGVYLVSWGPVVYGLFQTARGVWAYMKQ